MMKRRVVGAIVAGSWLIAVIPTALCTTYSSSDQTISVPKYGACVPEDNAFVRFTCPSCYFLVSSCNIPQ